MSLVGGGAVDIYFAFIEKYSVCADSLVFITPNSFLTSNAGSVLRAGLIDKLDLLIDFKEKKIFKDVGVYTCIFKSGSGGSNAEMIYGNNLNEVSVVNKSDLFGKTEDESGVVDTVLSGIATLCDAVYIVRMGDDGKFYATFNSQKYEVEGGIVVPYLKLTKIKSNKDIQNIDYMIYPYDDKGIIKEDELKEKYPLVYSYFLIVKERLLQRDRGKSNKYESWYAYGRKQGFHNIVEKYVVIIPRIIGGECKPCRLDISSLLSKFGRFVFTSGFVVPQSEKNNVACNHILGEKFIEFAKRGGRIWPGKNESYYNMTVKQIKRFKV